MILRSGRRLTYDKLIIATGALPWIPPIPGRDLDGVMGFKTGADLDRIMGAVRDGLKRAVVVGAGAIGVELAQAMHHAGCETTLVDMAESILPNLMDPDFCEPARESLEQHGIELILGTKVVELRGEAGRVRSVVLDNGRTLEFEARPDGALPGLVIFAAGVRPDLRLVEGTPIKYDRDGIVVNARMETNVPDVYACGDVVQFHSGITGKITGGKLATNAVPMGKTLARNLLGIPWEYPGFFNGSATKIYQWFLGGTGLTAAGLRREKIEYVKGEGETTTRFSIMPDTKPLRVRLFAEKKTGRLLGGQIISGEPVCARLDLITFAIQQKLGVREIMDLSYCAQPYQSFFPAANAIVNAAEDCFNQLEG